MAAPTVQSDLDLAKAALRRIAGASPATVLAQRGPHNQAFGQAIVDTFHSVQDEANKALNSLFENEYIRQAEQAEGPVGV